MMLVWERALRRAHLPVTYSKGFTPKPRISIASPLPVGHTAASEVIDIMLDMPVEPDEFAARLQPILPTGMQIMSVREVPVELPALQEHLCAAEYEVAIEPDPAMRPELTPDEIAGRVERLLATASLPRTRKRAEKITSYDLRTLIHDLHISQTGNGTVTLCMRLANKPGNTGRPEEVLDAMGIAGFGLGAEEGSAEQTNAGVVPDSGVLTRIHRTRLIFDEGS